MWRILMLVCATGLGISQSYAATLADVGFEFLHNQIVLRATIGGKGPLNFILDTGTRTAIIDLRLARELKLPLGPEGPIAGVGTGRTAGRRTVCPELKIGDLAVHDLEVSAIDLSALSGSLGRPLHGVLGFGFLSQRVAQIDYFHRRIRFLDSAPSPASTGDGPEATSFPMILRGTSVLPLLEDCYVNGIRISVTLDTGSSLGLILFPKAIDKLGLRELAKAGTPVQATGTSAGRGSRKGGQLPSSSTPSTLERLKWVTWKAAMAKTKRFPNAAEIWVTPSFRISS